MIFSNKIIGKNINLIILKIFLWLFHSFNLINEILILLILKKTIVYFFILHSFFWQWHKNETDIEKTTAYQWKMIRFLKIYNLVIWNNEPVWKNDPFHRYCAISKHGIMLNSLSMNFLIMHINFFPWHFMSDKFQVIIICFEIAIYYLISKEIFLL